MFRVTLSGLGYSSPIILKPKLIMLRKRGAHFDSDGLMQERISSTDNALELRLSCINPSICGSASDESYYIRGSDMKLWWSCSSKLKFLSNIDGLVQETRSSIANALEIRLSCINPSICGSASDESYYIRGSDMKLWWSCSSKLKFLSNIDGLVQETRSSIANALEIRLSCTNPSIWN